AEGLAADEAFEGFEAEGELAEGQRSLAPQAPLAEAAEVFVPVVAGTVDDPQVLATTALEGRLKEAAGAAGDEVEGFDHHSLTPGRGQLGPPIGRGFDLIRQREVDQAEGGSDEELWVVCADRGKGFHVPHVILVGRDLPLRCQQVEGGKAEVVERVDGPAV